MARGFWLPGLLSNVVLALVPASAAAWQYPVYDGTPALVRNSHGPARTPGEEQTIQDRLLREAMIRRVMVRAASTDAAPDPFGQPLPGIGEEGPAGGGPSGPGPRDPNSGPPPAAEAPAPEPSLQEKAGRASAAAAKSAQQVQGQLTRIRQAIEQAIAAHERAPAFDPVRENHRIRYFERLLAEAVRLGEQATADEVALRRSFETWKKASGAAATFFREAEAHFRAKAEQEPYARASSMYAKTADWYAARAARHELRSQLVVPSEFGEQMQELQAMTAASRELLTWVRNDEYYLEDGAGIEADLAAFLSAFSAVGDVLSSWTEKLLEDMAEPESRPSAEPEAESAPPTEKTAGQPVERFTSGTARPRVRPASWSEATPLALPPTGGAGGDFLDHVAGD
ncbi:hypothetical protein [Tautonia sociabilis]|nr:hypothetical protein [Tautonia sociabilis]